MRAWITRLLATWRPRRQDDDLEEELRLHLELAAADARRRGADPDRARRAAALGVGSIPQTLEALRDQRGLPWLDELSRDVRYGLRALRRNPTFACVALLTLAIGIGANTAVFSVVNGVLLEPLPYPEADRLVAVWLSAPGAPGLASVSGELRLSPSMYFTFAEQNRTFEQLGTWFPLSSSVTGLAEPEQVRTVLVSDGTLQALNVPPARGRWLSAADQKPGAAATVVLGYGYWQRRFGGDPSVIGRNLTVDSRPREIVGVMPKGFQIVTADPELILPLAFDRSRVILPGFGYQGIARLKPGITIEQAGADITRMVPIWMTSWPAATGSNPRVYETWRIAPALRPLKQDVIGNVTRPLWVLMGTIGIVMLIACANVANLLLVRAEGRQQELAIRAALGAGSRRIVRALLVESATLGLLGGALGLALAYGGLRLLVAVGPDSLPRLKEIGIEPRALGFTLAISLLSGVLFGLIPALKYSGPRISTELSGGGRTSSESKARHRARNMLVVAQVALALVLLVCSGLMIRTFQALRAVEPGFTGAEHVQTMRISIPAQLVQDVDRVGRMQHDIVDRLAAIPGVTSVGFTTAIPMAPGAANWDAIRTEGSQAPADQIPPMRVFKSVSPGLFQSSGTQLMAGRDFTWTDIHEHRPMVMVSENMARELWGGPSAAIGKRINTLIGDAPWREVIGVVEDVRDNGVHAPAPATVYWPSTYESPYRAGLITAARAVTFAIRSSRAGTEGLLNDIRRAVWSVNPALPLASVQTLQEIYQQSMARTSFTLVMLAIAATMALTLGVIGIYGVLSYVVLQRTREIGIRLALGAQRREVKGMFLRDGLALASAGVVIGLGAAAGLSRLMSSLLFEISPIDPLTYAVVPIVLVTAAALASYLPARRAASVDPVEALRAE
jgi:putative ABC transport system permease protein